MIRYVMKRLLLMIPIVLGVLLIIFTLLELAPGDAAISALGSNYTKEAYQAKLKEMGLDKPFLVRYVLYVKGFVTKFDLGTSYSNQRPVKTLIAQKIGVTLKLGLLSCVFTVIIGVLVGIFSAIKQYSALDYTSSALAIFFAAAPGFWLGLMLIILFTANLGWLPSGGLNSWKSYIMPVICLGMSPVAIILRMTRSSMLDVIRQDYIRTARAKGIPEKRVIYKHALQNALIPVITVIGMQLTMVIGGSVIIELIFSIPGLGVLMINSINSRDYPTVQGIALVISLFVCVVNLLTDIAYAAVDPRIREEYTGGSTEPTLFRRLITMKNISDGEAA